MIHSQKARRGGQVFLRTVAAHSGGLPHFEVGCLGCEGVYTDAGVTDTWRCKRPSVRVSRHEILYSSIRAIETNHQFLVESDRQNFKRLPRVIRLTRGTKPRNGRDRNKEIKFLDLDGFLNHPERLCLALERYRERLGILLQEEPIVDEDGRKDASGERTIQALHQIIECLLR